MKVRILTIATAVTVLAHSGSWATEMRVRDLEHMCQSRGWHAQPGMTGSPDELPMCFHHILGEVDGLDAMQRLAHGRTLFCLPHDAGPKEKVRVVRQYMRQHPETMSVDVGMMTAGALAYAYPCPPHRR